MRAVTGLLVISAIAEVIGILGTPPDARVLVVVVLIPAIVLNILFIIYSRRGKLWSYAGAMVVGIALILIQVAISFEPDGGPPTGIEALYIVLPALVSLKSYESILELRK